MSERILIATVMREVGETGVQTHFRAVSAYLKKKGNSAQLVTPFDAPNWLVLPVFSIRKLIDPINKTASVWWYRHWHAFFLKMALKKILSDDTLSVIYAQCPLSADAALGARKSDKQRVVMVVHFNISQADEWAGKGMIGVGGFLFNSIREFELNTLTKLNSLIFVSDFMRRQLFDRVPGINNISYKIIPNFISDPKPIEISKLPINDLICIGTLESRKNQSYAIRIVAAAKKIGTLLSLTFVGDGPSRGALEALAKDLDVVNQIYFVGFVQDGAKLFIQHRACLHVAQVENFPLTLVEALAYGKPIFAPAVGGVPEVFRNGIDGLFIPLDSAEKAAVLIIECLESDDFMKRASTAARNHYLNNFEESSVAKKLTDFLVI